VNKKWLYLIILFICLSLAGIIVVQYLWIRNAFQIRESQFNQGTNDALSAVVSNLEKRENMALIESRLISDSIMKLIRTYAKDTMQQEHLEINLDKLRHMMAHHPERAPKSRRIASWTMPKGSTQPLMTNFQMSFYWDAQAFDKIDSALKNLETQIQFQDDHLQSYYDYQIKSQQLIDSLTDANISLHYEAYKERMEDYVADAYEKQFYELENTPPDPDDGMIIVSHNQSKNRVFVPPQPSQQNYQYNVVTDKKGFISGSSLDVESRIDEEIKSQAIIENQILKLSKRAKILEELIQRMALEYEEIPKNIEARVDKTNLKKILSETLTDHNIDIPFEFAVYNPVSDTNPLPIRSKGFNKENLSTVHRVSLFPNDVIKKPDQLMLYFPTKESHILQSLSFLLLGSLLFTLIIISSSGLSIFVMIRQKKISDIKTDFINNMTHEFKTPIATISIATDSISNHKVLTEPEKIKPYLKIIKEENSRMNTSVEQVLQMSFLDSRDFKISNDPIDFQDIIKRSADHFQLIVSKRNGVMIKEYDAVNPMILGDNGHLRNVVNNLLDNANKYSLKEPKITIRTENIAGKFVLTIADQGVGMSKDIQKKIFDKFYRVSTGNVHNIKGFGLGLSYVKAIILAHNGEIHVASEPGKGSRFVLSIPTIPPAKIPGEKHTHSNHNEQEKE
jgi:signal transduction histidine kinase